MLLPSTLVRLLFEHYPHEFRRRLVADTDKLRNFWAEFLSQPHTALWASRHPFLRGKTVGDLVCTVPCVVHSDAGPCTKRASCNVLSWSVLLSVGDEKLCKFVIASYLKKASGGDEHAWARIVEDFDELATSVVGGVAVANEGRTTWKCVMLLCKSDEEVKVNEFGMTSYNAPAGEVCADCLCNDTTRPWTDLSRGWEWRRTAETSFGAFNARFRTPRHALVDSHYFCDRWFFYFELMHLADCKGVAALAFGSVLAMLLQKRTLGRTRADRLQAINEYMKDWYKRRPGWHRLPPLRPTSLRDAQGWANLVGPTVKAANTRAFTPLLRDFARVHFASGSDRDRNVLGVLEGLASYYELLYAAPRFLPMDSIALLRQICFSIVENWMALRAAARVRSELTWKISPKVHKLQHTPLYASVLNPRHVQVYAEESLVGTTVNIWKKSVSGRYQRTVQGVVLFKRLLALLLRFET